MALFMHLFTLAALQELKFDPKLSTLRKIPDPKKPSKASYALDGPHMIVGILTMFKQFHNSHFRYYVQHMTHYHKCLVNAARGNSAEATYVLLYLDEMLKFDGEVRDVVGQQLGGFVFDCYM